MATTASTAANSASRIGYTVDSSMSGSRRDSSTWLAADSDAIHKDPPPSVSQEDPFFSPVTPPVSSPTGKDTSGDNDNADKKPVWNKPPGSSVEVGHVMGAESWPSLLSPSARASSNKPPSLESNGSPPLPPPQGRVTPPGSSNSNAIATSSENHIANGQRKPFRRNNNTPSSSSNISNQPNAASLNTRDQNHNQRGGSYGSGTGTNQFRGSNRNRNSNNSYPRGDHGNRRNYEHGNQSGFNHRNYNGRDMNLQTPRGVGMMRPQMLMGPPFFPASSAQYMAAPQIGSYGGPMLYPDYAPHIFMPHPSPESMAFGGPFPPLPMYYPSPDAMLYHKILTQVEYYFSADNLSRDEFLRSHMDDEGWVPVRVISGFRKLAELTNNIQTILEAVRSSEVVEIKGETIRRRGDWDKYLLPRGSLKSGPAAAAKDKDSLQSQMESMTLSQSSRGDGV